MTSTTASAPNMPGRNWAGNLAYHADRLLVPDTLDEAREMVRTIAKLRVLGSRHCFNDIADTTGALLSLERLTRVVSLDRARRQVTVEAGIHYKDLAPYLYEQGFALPNLASLPHITIAGACATATHGSGTALGNLATQVAALEFIDASGSLFTVSREADPDTFPGAVVHLGALGCVARLTLDLVPAFDLRQDVFLDLPVEAAASHFDAIMASGYSVSLFTDWRGAINQVWIKTVAGAAPPTSLHGARPATENVHPVAGQDPINCTGQMGVVGPYYDRLPHYRAGFVPAGGGDYQAEYFVATHHAAAALSALDAWGDRLTPLLMACEIRTVAADDLWMSPCYRQPSVALHFSFHPDWPALESLLPELEAVLAPFAPQPHWGKLFAIPADRVRARFPKGDAFRNLLESRDPGGKFRNRFIDRFVFGTG